MDFFSGVAKKPGLDSNTFTLEKRQQLLKRHLEEIQKSVNQSYQRARPQRKNFDTKLGSIRPNVPVCFILNIMMLMVSWEKFLSTRPLELKTGCQSTRCKKRFSY